jgi:hypothetical protein
MIRQKKPQPLYIILFICILPFVQGINTPLCAQESVKDTILISDSIREVNRRNLKAAEAPVVLPVPKDSLPALPVTKPQWIPNSNKATWLAVIFPGAGQIYNRKYWKLPIFYGGFAGCAYALSWNNNMYRDYAQAYRDLMDDNPNTNSYQDLLPPNHGYSDSQLQSTLKNRKDRFRRYRDMSIFAFVGVYLLSIVDAYVDAELSDFDISPDLSMRIEPTSIKSPHTSGSSLGIQCRLRF